MRCIIPILFLIVSCLSACRTPLPSQPTRISIGTVTTNPVFLLQFGVGLPKARTVGIYDSSNAVNGEWRLLLTLSSQVLTQLVIAVEPKSDGNRFFKWEVMR